MKGLKKILGIFAIIIGFIALITPFTPGATWLIFIGFQLLGFHFAFWDKIFGNTHNSTKSESLKKEE